jgi:hypothetical protein
MTALEFIKLKQKSWAEKYIKKQNKNNEEAIQLVSGSLINGKDSNNNQDYFDKIKYNLFPISDDKNINEYGLKKINNDAYSKGSGNEITDKIKKKENKTITTRAKMKATFSSSAIVVNLFQYWQEKKDITPLLKALMGNKCPKILKNIKINFESKIFPIKINNKTIATPNIDITITYEDENENKYVIAIESKFTEPYKSKTYQGLGSKQYNDDSLWNDLPNIKEKRNITTKHLDYPQLIKHILGLRTDNKKISKDKKITLLYLWYDVPGTEGYEHRQEIEYFKKLVKDKVDFRHITYQEVIFYLKENHYAEHENYINYLVERYL